MRYVGLGIAALVLLGTGAPDAAACGWLWACTDRPQAGRACRDDPRAYGHRGVARPRSHRGAARTCGHTSRARGRGYAYAGRAGTSIPPSRWYLGTALPGASTHAVGLTPPVYGGQGLLMGALPAGGPTLFGPQPAPAAAWGYYYAAPAYGPPRETPSWWVEQRRRR
jgi:hypothetical protein